MHRDPRAAIDCNVATRWWIVLLVVAVLETVPPKQADAYGVPTPRPSFTPRPTATTLAPAAAASPSEATTQWSRQHLFRASYVSSPSPVPSLKTHEWTVTIVDASERPVADARVTVLGGMPAHSHGLPTTPQVKNLGGGRYLIEGMKFHMPGDWVVALRIKAGSVVDSVQFDLHLE